ncbi:TSUP family transporter [Demequina salsinemoris]|uniref:TSUP family transporter n=1 Tax=Demequina salsinemoris TaxID=577470 RepID=UPI0007846EB3|nr:TSUP family transporter [Demequina salsinemoris]
MALIIAAVLAGSLLHRVSGIGFAIVVAPFVVLALGPGPGIVLVQLFGVIVCFLVLLATWRDIDWRAYAVLVPPSLVGIWLGVLAAQRLPLAQAQIVAAAILIASLIAIMAVRGGHLPRNPPMLAGGGLVAGLMTTLAGAGGVALIVLARATRWEQASFAATLQPYLITISSTTVVARLVADPADWPDLSVLVWVGLVVAMTGGLLAGNVLARRLSRVAASRVTLAVGWVGALATLVDGVLKLG